MTTEEWRVWAHLQNGAGHGERFQSLEEAEAYFKHLSDGPSQHVTLEAVTVIKEHKKGQ